MTSFPESLALAESGRKQVLNVEDWAEIRRLRRADQMPISEIAWVIGISRNTVKAALASQSLKPAMDAEELSVMTAALAVVDPVPVAVARYS